MKVVFMENVERIANRGDIKNVADGYARNFLFPRNLAVKATPAKMKEIEKKIKSLEKKDALEEVKARETAEKLQGVKIIFRLPAGKEGKLFGSVTAADIALQLEEQGYSFDKKKIEIAEPIKTLGEHTVVVKLKSQVSSEVKIVVENENADFIETEAVETENVKETLKEEAVVEEEEIKEEIGEE